MPNCGARIDDWDGGGFSWGFVESVAALTASFRDTSAGEGDVVGKSSFSHRTHVPAAHGTSPRKLSLRDSANEVTVGSAGNRDRRWGPFPRTN